MSKTPHQFIGEFKEDELVILLELVYQTYEDGNLYEWFCDIADLDSEAYRSTFEKVTTYMTNGEYKNEYDE